MPDLVNITPDMPNGVPVWAFHGKIDVNDVREALTMISAKLKGDGNIIEIMSGTHGYCDGAVGAVATREERFAEEDRGLTPPRTADGKTITVNVHDFNNAVPDAPDPITAVMAKLNGDMRKIANGAPGKHIFLLAYCCSAGTVQPAK